MNVMFAAEKAGLKRKIENTRQKNKTVG